MFMCFIFKFNVIILVVIVVNIDLVNLDGLKLVCEVDLEGSRIIGVFIKVDLMD